MTYVLSGRSGMIPIILISGSSNTNRCLLCHFYTTGSVETTFEIRINFTSAF